MHIVDKLREDHERMSALLEKIRQQTNGAAERRGSLVGTLGRELAAHASFQEAVFYPAVRDGNDVTELVGQAVSELHDIEDKLNSMHVMEPASAEFTQALRDVEAAVTEHLRREEEEIFPLALEIIGRDEAEEMAERHDAMTRGQP